ncbi:MAG TPA: type II secretion system ATPase GspE [Bacilli bacterium]|nr:type II secretion system ATPase GspE [Bacilli bacterium]
MKLKKKRLGDLLVESGLLTNDKLKFALDNREKGEKLGDALIRLGLISEQQLIEVLEFQLGIPHVSLYNYPIEEELLSIVPKELVKKYRVVPIKKRNNKLVIAMSDPLDFYAVDDLRLATGFQIERVIATKDDINRIISKYYELDESMQEMLKQLGDGKSEQNQQDEEDSDSPVIRLVNQILLNAIQRKASDIHIDPMETKISVRYRIDGVLQNERTLPKQLQKMIISRVKIMARLNITETRIPQDGRIKINLGYHSVDLRISILPTVFGEKIVMRILDMGTALLDLKHLGFSEKNLQRFIQMVEKPNGIILVTGPTGSGKSSTLYATLNRINSEKVNIITVEDPVEYQLEGINQVQVNPTVGLTFAAGLRSILRQDPDIVMVGEIRDYETAEIAIRASLTGHLVLSTLHTNDSLSSITRLIDMGVEPFLVSASLNGVVAQRLVRRVCRDCRAEQEVTEREKEIFAKNNLQIERIIRGKGCPACNMTGYKGRVAIHEVLLLDEKMKRLISSNVPLSDLKEHAISQGMDFLLKDGLQKVRDGLTTTEEVLRVSSESE